MAESLTLTQPPPSDAQREIVAAIGEAARRLSSQVHNLLDMAAAALSSTPRRHDAPPVLSRQRA